LTLWPRLLRFLGGQACAGDLRIGEHHRRDHLRVHLGRLFGDDLGGDLGLARSLVRQHGLPGHVADGEDVGHAGAHLAIHGDEAARGLDPCDFQADVLDVGPATHCHQDLVGLDVDGTALALDGQHRAVALFDDALGLGAKQNFHAQLLRLARDHLHALGIAAGQHGGQGLDEGDLAAELGVQRADLHADVAGAHHHQARGQLGEGERAGRIDHAFAVERQAGNGHRARARGDDDVLGFDQDFVLGAWSRDANRARRKQRCRAFAVVAAVGLEQLADARGEFADDGVLPLLQAGEIDAQVVEVNAHLRGVGPAFSYSLDALMSAFEGMQPTFRHTPPGAAFSTTRTFLRSWPRRMPAT
jgi:hypothetical protein